VSTELINSRQHGLIRASSPTYLNLRANNALCETYAQDVGTFESRVQIKQQKPMNASTDMGNVSHLVPSFHGGFIIPAGPEISAHNPGFAACAGTEEAHKAALTCAKGMAVRECNKMQDYPMQQVRFASALRFATNAVVKSKLVRTVVLECC
jgi:metal-dependent amidase/aminoacylase/carboxypeptidase family protein